MKAITIKQPWATLIALGEKQFETRSWQTKYRGPLAIHAGKSIDKDACRCEPIHSTLAKHGYSENNLPVGVILATSILKDCYKVLPDSAFLSNGELISDNEIYFGDFSEGRYAWQLQSVEMLRRPIQAKGQLSIWEWNGEIF